MCQLIRKLQRVVNPPCTSVQLQQPLLGDEEKQKCYHNKKSRERGFRVDVPKGFLPVYVGKDLTRLVINARFLNHPIFAELLQKSAQEYDYEQKGGQVDESLKFLHVMRSRRCFPDKSFYSAAILQLMNGASTFPNLAFGWVGVVDVAEAHILAFEVSSANGRYLLVDRVVHYSKIVTILGKLYPGCPLPTKCVDDKPFVPTYKVSKEKAEKSEIRNHDFWQ